MLYKMITWFMILIVFCSLSAGIGYSFGMKHIEKGYLYIEGFKAGTDFGMKCILKYR
jgi:hypothetical protein